MAGGGLTYEYLDLKGVFTTGLRMSRLAGAMLDYSQQLGINFGTVGGPSMGADVIAHTIAIHDYTFWFSVRDEPKDHGLQRVIEGVRLDERHRVLLVDDVVSSGKSLLRAFHAVQDTGAKIVAVMPVVDRSGLWQRVAGVPYYPLFTHVDLGIDSL